MAIDSTTTTFNHRYTCCCLPIIHSGSNSNSVSKWWRSISQQEDKWWTKGVRALINFRECSEVISGPRWKTFIRRFNRNRSENGSGGLGGGGTFNYDPLSYSLNFDEGGVQNGVFYDEEIYGGTRGFSARYAAVSSDGS